MNKIVRQKRKFSDLSYDCECSLIQNLPKLLTTVLKSMFCVGRKSFMIKDSRNIFACCPRHSPVGTILLPTKYLGTA